MPKFPEPPSANTLAKVQPQIRVLPPETALWRIYRQGGQHPTLWNQFRSWGPTSTARFDHHLEPARNQDRKILYAAVHGPTCVAEVFGDSRVIHRTRSNPYLVGFELAREVALLDLTGTWPTQAGASMNIASGPRSRARRWSRTIYTAHPTIDGLYYPSSMNANKPAVALYERAVSAMPARPIMNKPLLDSSFHSMLSNAAVSLNYRLM